MMTSRALAIMLAYLAMLISGHAETCKSVFECSQIAVEAAQRAEKAVAALQEQLNKGLMLDCKIATANSSFAEAPSVEVTIPSWDEIAEL